MAGERWADHGLWFRRIRQDGRSCPCLDRDDAPGQSSSHTSKSRGASGHLLLRRICSEPWRRSIHRHQQIPFRGGHGYGLSRERHDRGPGAPIGRRYEHFDRRSRRRSRARAGASPFAWRPARVFRSATACGPRARGWERKLLAERADLLDAFDETAPRIEIAGEPEEVSGDVIAIAGGATLGGTIIDRRQLAEANRALFEAFGKAVADHGTGRELVIIVTNPVELGVEIVSRYIDRHRVLGMGAQQDALRFSRAIAADVGLRRDKVHAWSCKAQLPGQSLAVGLSG